MTTPDANNLLRLLGGAGGVRGVGASAPAAGAGSTRIDDAGFADLLKLAEDGGITSGRKVTVSGDAGVELGEADLLRLSLAADRAEAAGVSKALVMTPQGGLILDVHSRTVVGKADLSSGVVAGVDGVMQLDLAPRDESESLLGVPGASLVSNPSLAGALEARRRAAG